MSHISPDISAACLSPEQFLKCSVRLWVSHRSISAASCIEAPKPFTLHSSTPELRNLLPGRGRPVEGSQLSRSPVLAAGKTVAACSSVKAVTRVVAR